MILRHRILPTHPWERSFMPLYPFEDIDLSYMLHLSHLGSLCYLSNFPHFLSQTNQFLLDFICLLINFWQSGYLEAIFDRVSRNAC